MKHIHKWILKRKRQILFLKVPILNFLLSDSSLPSNLDESMGFMGVSATLVGLFRISGSSVLNRSPTC